MKAWKLKVGQRRTPIVPLAHTLARVYLRLELKPIRVPWKVVMMVRKSTIFFFRKGALVMM
jgi:hypothetical protein